MKVKYNEVRTKTLRVEYVTNPLLLFNDTRLNIFLLTTRKKRKINSTASSLMSVASTWLCRVVSSVGDPEERG